VRQIAIDLIFLSSNSAKSAYSVTFMKTYNPNANKATYAPEWTKLR